MRHLWLIVLYLAAITAANLVIAALGPSAAIPVAFLFIGLDLTARDSLHELWNKQNMVLKMAILIASGSLISAVLNWQSSRVAIASFLAFAAAGVSDTAVYALLRERSRLFKINGSNVVSSAVDSLVFPAIAFGVPILWQIVLGQFVAKVAGGFVWSLILRRTEIVLFRLGRSRS